MTSGCVAKHNECGSRLSLSFIFEECVAWQVSVKLDSRLICTGRPTGRRMKITAFQEYRMRRNGNFLLTRLASGDTVPATYVENMDDRITKNTKVGNEDESFFRAHACMCILLDPLL